MRAYCPFSIAVSSLTQPSANVTYDATGQYVATPASTGEPIVYNLADFSWIMTSAALVMCARLFHLLE